MVQLIVQGLESRLTLAIAPELLSAQWSAPLATLAQDYPLLEVEVICSNAAEHQRRVETRAMEVPGLLAPTWQAVLQHDYAHWGQERLVVDTARSSAAA